jgi:hypothetical protein
MLILNLKMSLENSVVTAIGYELDWSGLIPGRAKFFSSS